MCLLANKLTPAQTNLLRLLSNHKLLLSIPQYLVSLRSYTISPYNITFITCFNFNGLKLPYVPVIRRHLTHYTKYSLLFLAIKLINALKNDETLFLFSISTACI